EMQENPIPNRAALSVPPLTRIAAPQGDSAAVAETASLLLKAENPVIIADRAVRSQQGMDHLVELAEALQCPVIDAGGRGNFPNRHVLCHSGRSGAVLGQADLILGLEVSDFFGTTHLLSDRIVRKTRSITKPGAKTIHVTSG